MKHNMFFIKMFTIFLFIGIFTFNIKEVKSLNNNYKINNLIVTEEKDNNIVFVADDDPVTEETNTNQSDIGGCTGLLGDPTNGGDSKNPASIAYILQKILNYLKILGPLLVIILSGMDFTKATLSGDDDAMKKAVNALKIRLILVVVLFLIPYLTQLILSIINGSLTDPTCAIK